VLYKFYWLHTTILWQLHTEPGEPGMKWEDESGSAVGNVVEEAVVAYFKIQILNSLFSFKGNTADL
jgi:hypothetical protein